MHVHEIDSTAEQEITISFLFNEYTFQNEAYFRAYLYFRNITLSRKRRKYFINIFHSMMRMTNNSLEFIKLISPSINVKLNKLYLLHKIEKPRLKKFDASIFQLYFDILFFSLKHT